MRKRKAIQSSIPAARPPEPLTDAVYEIKRKLISQEAKERQDGAWELRELSSKSDVSSFLPLMPSAIRASLSPESGTMSKGYLTEAALHAAERGSDIGNCVPALLEALADNAIQVRSNSLQALALHWKRGGREEGMVEAVYARLSDIAPIVKEAAMALIKEMASDSRTAEAILSQVEREGPKSYHDELKAACNQNR